jgi:hypothetical protein
MYSLTLLSPMSKPSLSSSPWMRGPPQPGFSRHILRIRSRTSREIRDRPGWPRRTFQVQNRRKPARCQATTVSSLTRPEPSAVAPDAGKPDPQPAFPRGQFRTFSRGPLKDADLSQVLQLEGAAREPRIEDRVAKSVWTEISIGTANYETTITLISSDISRFSRSTNENDQHRPCGGPLIHSRRKQRILKALDLEDDVTQAVCAFAIERSKGVFLAAAGSPFNSQAPGRNQNNNWVAHLAASE